MAPPFDDHLRHVQKMEALGAMGSGIAHDFNNLLSVIVASLDLADRRLPGDHPAVTHIDAARRAAQRAGEQTHKLLAFSRRSVLNPEPVRLDELCREAVSLVQPTVDPRIELQLRSVAGLWPAVGDPGEIVQVLVNLLLNARDVMPEGGRVRLETENVIVGEAYAHAAPERHAGHFVCVRAIDDGPGMTPEVKARIFEPFFTTKELGRGTGLGLSMAYGTLKRHHGWIDCHSVPGHGTTFSLYFPRQPAHARALDSPDEIAGVRGGCETILLVEDQPGVREVTTESLRELGYEVLSAGDGLEALHVFAAARDRIRLVILDLSMPRLNGRDTLAALRSMDGDVRVLLTSGAPGSSAAVRQWGGVAFVAKPYTLSQIAGAVRAALEDAPLQGAAHSSRTTS